MRRHLPPLATYLPSPDQQGPHTEEEGNQVQRLLLLLARPARLLECIEFDPNEVASLLSSLTAFLFRSRRPTPLPGAMASVPLTVQGLELSEGERGLQQAALKHDVPTYIMGRLTAHFGGPSHEVCATPPPPPSTLPINT